MSSVSEQKNQHAVIITGANGGIGLGLVAAFARAGYHVIATDLQAPAQDASGATFIAADLQQTVADETYADDVFSQIRQALAGRPLKALINNAAVQVLGKTEKLSREDWRKTMDVNVLAPFFWTQALVPELEAGTGCVLNISSIHARLTKPNFAAYATSKAAMSGLTRALAIDLGGRIRVNAIEPAAIDTPMLRAGFENDPEGYAQLQRLHPSKSIGTPEQVANLALVLVEAETPFLNGALVPLDGGISHCLLDSGNC